MQIVAPSAAVFASAIFFAANSHTAHVAPQIHHQTIGFSVRADQPKSANNRAHGDGNDPHKTNQNTNPAGQNNTGKATKSATVAKPTVITVKSGDYLTKIAKANDTTALRLFYKNAKITDPDLIFPGETLTVPAPEKTLTPRPVPANTQITAAPAPAATTTVSEPQAPVPAVIQPTTQPVTAAAPVAASGSAWDRIAACESGGDWSINTGNGYYGGLQFSLGSWRGVGGSGLPSQASRNEQIARAKMLQAREGWNAWPVCSVKAGL